jgi:hypothetical protein
MKRERLKARLENLYARLDRRFGGGLSLLVRTGLAFGQDDGPLAARSIAYYAVFAVFPALLALIIVASAVLESEGVQKSVMALLRSTRPSHMRSYGGQVKFGFGASLTRSRLVALDPEVHWRGICRFSF